MKSIILFAFILITTTSNAQVEDDRTTVSKNPGFMSFADKIKQLPPNEKAAKMKASGISMILSPTKMEHDQYHYLEYERARIVRTQQVGFEKNTTKEGFDGPVFYIVTHREKNAVCLVEVNLWLPRSEIPHEFHISSNSGKQTIKVDTKNASAYINKKIVKF